MRAQRPSKSLTRREAIAGLVGTAVAASGCSREVAGKTTLRFWAMGREGEVASQLIDDFMRLNSDIHVDVQKLPFTAAHEKLLTAYAGDTLPDLCQLGNTWIPEFVALKALQPLDEIVAASSAIPLQDYFEGILETNRLGGTLYGIPWYIDTRLLFYRRDLLRDAGFQSPPQSWDEWVEMLAAVKRMVGAQRYSVLLPLNEYEPLLVLALQKPTELLREHGRWGNFRSADFRHTVSFYREMFVQDWAPKMSNTQISNVWDELGNGLFTFYISGPWNIAEFQARLPARLQDAWMTAPMPGPTGPGASVAGGSSLVIPATSQRKAEAWRLVEYLSRRETQLRFYELTGDMPPRRSTWEFPRLAQSEHVRAFRIQLDRLNSPPKVPEWERIAMGEMRLASERVALGRASVEQATAQLDQAVDRILEKRRWMLDRGRAT
jgi:multiple sugar transport system substrate-binding protein